MNKTKKLIFDASIKTFSRKGFHKSTMDEIAETAGVVKGTLYYHFKSKEDIFKFIIDEGIKLVEDEVKDRTRHLLNPVDKLRTVCQVQLELVMNYLEFFKTILGQMWGDEDRQRQLRDAFAKYFKIIEGYLREAADKGYIADGNIEIVAYNFFGVMTSSVVYSLIHKNIDIDEFADTFIEFVMRGLGKKNSP